MRKTEYFCNLCHRQADDEKPISFSLVAFDPFRPAHSVTGIDHRAKTRFPLPVLDVKKANVHICESCFFTVKALPTPAIWATEKEEPTDER